MMMEMAQDCFAAKVFATLERHGMLQTGDCVVVALSGGADSVALFHFFAQNRAALGVTMKAAHFEHGLRGEESLRDAAFCERLCKAAGVQLYVGHGNMCEVPRPKGKGTEAWARELRYAFFADLAEAQRAKVAVAHTLSDNAETVLFNAARGASARGLSGIAPVKGHIIRPFLGVDRSEVEAYCSLHGLAFCTDSTNFDEGFARNKIRRVALPALEEAHPGAARALSRLAGDMREVDVFLAELAEGLLEKAGQAAPAGRFGPLPERQSARCDAKTLREAPPPVRLAAFARLAGRDADRPCLARMERVLFGECAAASLPNGREARMMGGVFVVGLVESAAVTAKDAGEDAVDGAMACGERSVGANYEIPLAEGEHVFPGGFRAVVEIIDWPLEKSVYEKSAEKGLTFLADCDKILDYGVFRTRRPGDRFAEAGRGVTKTLKKLYSEEHLEPVGRALLPLVAKKGGGEVLFLWGRGFCEGLAPDEQTRQVLVIRQLLQ